MSSKRLKAANNLVDSNQRYSLEEALDVVAKYAKEAQTKFKESLDVVIKLGIDAKQSDQMVRGAVSMPNGLGKEVRVAVFVKPEKVNEAKAAGADIAGSEDLIEAVKNGQMDFDVCIATPDMMAPLSKLGKVLGPKGLMPNPKLGTVAEDFATAIKNVKAGQAEYKSDKAGLVHAAIGKIDFEKSALKENVLALYKAVVDAKPASSKGIYIRDFYLSPTMGPSIRVDLDKIVS
ncbi:MAG: 50S ribosomal protein L1 [Alphaproteobacteria bacterium]|jgi:large subunit ribosomal protein L1